MLDQAEIQTPPAAPPGVETPPTPETSAPRTTGVWARAMERLRPAPRTDEADGGEESGASAEVASPPSTPTAVTPSAPAETWTPPTSREEHERAVQAEVDRREYRRQIQQQEQAARAREQQLNDLRNQYRQARQAYGDDSVEAAQISARIDDLQQGIEREHTDVQSLAQLERSVAAREAGKLHKAAVAPLLEDLPEPELQELSRWWTDHIKVDPHTGQSPLEAEVAVAQMVKRIAEKRDEFIRQQTIDGLKEELDHNPELRAQLLHWIQGGDYAEPEHLVGGSPAGLPTDAQLDAMTPQQYAKLKLTPEAERRLLTRPRRN